MGKKKKKPRVFNFPRQALRGAETQKIKEETNRGERKTAAPPPSVFKKGSTVFHRHDKREE